MFRLSWCPRRCALTILFVCLPYSAGFAHCFVGDRFFPATLVIDDPCVADEMSLPTVQWSRTGGVPSATEWDVSAELSCRPGDLSRALACAVRRHAHHARQLHLPCRRTIT